MSIKINYLKKLVNNNLDYSFNSISVDGDTSTSDTLAIFSVKTNKINFILIFYYYLYKTLIQLKLDYFLNFNLFLN